MTAYDLRRRALDPASRPILGTAALGAVAAWAAFLTAAVLGRVASPVSFWLLCSAPAALLGLAALLARPASRRPLGRAAAVAAAIGFPVLAAFYVEPQPLFVLAVPVVAGATVACRARPAGALIFAFFLTGTFNSMEVFTPVPVGQTVDLLLGGLWIAAGWQYLTTTRERPVWLWPGVAITLLYLALTLLQALASGTLQAPLYSFRISAWYLAAVLLIGYSGLGPDMLRRIARGIAVVALIVGAYSLFRYFAGPSGGERAAGKAAAGTYNTVNGQERLIGPFPTGHHLAVWTAVVAPFCLGLALTWKDRWRLVAAAGGGLCVLALIASEVRTGLVAVIAGAVLVLLLYQLSRGFAGPHLGITATALVLAVGIGVFSYSIAIKGGDSQQRYSNILHPSADPSAQRRFTKWSQAMVDIRHHPLGLGLGASGEAEKRYSRFTSISSYQLDNSYLHVAIQQGMGMLVLFGVAILTLLGGLIRRGLVSDRRSAAGVAIAASGSLVSLMVMMVTGLYIEGLPALACWMIVGLAVAHFASPMDGEYQPAPGAAER